MITGHQLRAARKFVALKQKELARLSHISLSTLNKIERGLSVPRASTVSVLERTFRSLGVEFDHQEGRESVSLLTVERAVSSTEHPMHTLLSLFKRDSFFRARKLLAFPCGSPEGVKVGFCVEGDLRTLLFDRLALSLITTTHLAEISGVLFAALSLQKTIYRLDCVVETSESLTSSEMYARLKGETWIPFQRPQDFFALFMPWTECVSLAGRPDHLLFTLVELCERVFPEEGETGAFQ